MDKAPSKFDQLRALREVKSSRGVTPNTRKSVVGEDGARMRLSVETDPATDGTARKAPMARSTRLDKPQPGKEYRPGPREPLVSENCPVCAARRLAKRVAQAKWRKSKQSN